MWRIISLVIIGFWLVMTSLLVRYEWYPEGTRFSEVQPTLVLRRFLEQSSAESATSPLRIYHRDRYLGFANIRCIRLRPGRQDYQLRMECFLEKGAAAFTPEKVSWSLSLKLLNVDEFGELKGKVRIEGTPWFAEFLWQKGQSMPVIKVMAPEEAGINDAMIQLMMAQAFATGGVMGVPAELASKAGADGEGMLRVRARQSEMDFAGQKSKGHLLDFTVMDRWKARAFITEAGEFVLLNLPEGYRLVEPVIHGLVPDYDAEDEEEQALSASPKVENGKVTP